jgi:predicted MFS family arabinose efflux permease
LWGLLALAATAFMTVMTELLPAGLLPQMSRAFHVPEGQTGFLVSGYAAASCLAAIPLTAALRRVRRRVVLVSGLAGFAAANLVTAASSSYPLTFTARVLAGTMSGMLWAMLAGYAARMVVAECRGRAIAIVMSGVTVALSLGIPAAAALAATLGWRAAFAGMVVLAVILVGWAWWKVPDFPGQVAGRVPLRRIVGMPGLPIVLSMTLCLLAGHQAVCTPTWRR